MQTSTLPDTIVEFQTRNDDGALCFFPTWGEAFTHAKDIDPSVWKISYTDETNKRRRFVKVINADYLTITFVEQPLLDVVAILRQNEEV